MRHLRVGALTAVVGLVVGAGIASAVTPKPKTVSFKGSYAGQVTEKVDGTNVTALAVATGTGTAIGKGKLSGTVAASTANPPCSVISGSGLLTGPKGNLKLTLVASRACAASEDDQNNITVSGTAKVTAGTLVFKKAKGSIHFSGHYDRAGGTFNVTFTGTLTY